MIANFTWNGLQVAKIKRVTSGKIVGEATFANNCHSFGMSYSENILGLISPGKW